VLVSKAKNHAYVKRVISKHSPTQGAHQGGAEVVLVQYSSTSTTRRVLVLFLPHEKSSCVQYGTGARVGWKLKPRLVAFVPTFPKTRIFRSSEKLREFQVISIGSICVEANFSISTCDTSILLLVRYNNVFPLQVVSARIYWRTESLLTAPWAMGSCWSIFLSYPSGVRCKHS